MSNQKYKESIDLLLLLKYVLNARKNILIVAFISAMLGVIFALISPVYYASKVTFVPQGSGSEGGVRGLSNLAAIAGIDLSGRDNSGISPTLYPHIFGSIYYQKELLNSEISLKGIDTTVTLFEYYNEIYEPRAAEKILKYTIGLPTVIRSAISPSSESAAMNQSDNDPKGLAIITKAELRTIRKLKNQLFITVNDLDGYVTISAEMPEALSSAELVTNAMAILQNKIVEHKIEKAKTQLEFIDQRYQERLKEFQEVQVELAEFRDRNSNISTAVAQTSLQMLESKYDLAYNVFQELAQQLENQRIQVKRDTPLFTIIEPVVVPVERARPKRAMIVFLFVFLGVLLSVGYHTLRYYFKPTAPSKQTDSK